MVSSSKSSYYFLSISLKLWVQWKYYFLVNFIKEVKYFFLVARQINFVHRIVYRMFYIEKDGEMIRNT